MTKPSLEIEYCTSCNYLARALWICAELLPDMQYDVASVVLRCSAKGEFNIRLDGKVLFSKAASGRFPEPDELRQLIFDDLEARTRT